MPVNMFDGAINLPAKPATAHVKMEMIPVGGVVVGAENRAESLAGAAMYGREKLSFVAATFPMAFNGDPATIV